MNQLVTAPNTAKKPRKAPQARQPRRASANTLGHPDINPQFPITKGANRSRSSVKIRKGAGHLEPDGIELKRRQAANVEVQLSTKTMDKLASFRYQAAPAVESQDPYTFPPSGQPQEDNEPNHSYTGVMRSNAATFPDALGSALVTEDAATVDVQAHSSTQASEMDVDEEFPLSTSHMDGLLVNSGEDSDSSEESTDLLLSGILSGTVKPDSGGLLSGIHDSDDDTSHHIHANDIITRAEPKYQNTGHDAYTFRTSLTVENELHGGEVGQSLPDLDVHFDCYEDDVEVGLRCTPISTPSVLKTCGEQMMDDFEEYFLDEMEEECYPQILAVQESFEPPSDMQLPFDDDKENKSQTNEVYNPNLQYSSPLPKTIVSSGRVNGSTLYGSTTMDAFRQLDTGSSPALRFSSPGAAIDDADDFLDNEIDLEVLDLADRASKTTHLTLLAPLPKVPLTPKLQWRSPVTYESIQSSFPAPTVHLDLSPAPTRRPAPTAPAVNSTLVPAVTSQVNPPPSPLAAAKTSRPTQVRVSENALQVAKHLVAFGANGNALPVVRPPFPKKVPDRSPILGLSSSPLLRTCFRIGEALNAATVASHTNLDPLIELYARVTYSQRVGVEQFFQFADLFRSDRPPFLNGLYVGWKGVDLWDCDSKYFLGQSGNGKIARCVGKLKRDETNRGSWKMVVLSIWEASWGDVGYVKGIVCS